jgi:enamine deaminase RidA (YjgF/YER057c/UK114 family)
MNPIPNPSAIDGLHFINPPGLYDPAPNGYSHVAVFPAGWRWVLPSGQGGETADEVLSPDFAAQFRQALANTQTALAAGGATLADVAKVTLLIVDHDEAKFQVMTQEIERAWGPRKPACTLIPVPTLALPGMLVEIDVVAVVPA